MGLRHISFSMDYYRMHNEKPKQQSFSSKVFDEYRQRQDISLNPASYNLLYFLVYCYYPPLYFAGPICSFNSFISQVEKPFIAETWSTLLRKILFVLLLFLSIDIYMHFYYWA